MRAVDWGLHRAPEAVLVVSVVLWALTRRVVFAYFVCGYVLMLVFATLVKLAFSASDVPYSLRPQNSAIRCGMGGGFPSGHAVALAFTAGFWTLVVCARRGSSSLCSLSRPHPPSSSPSCSSSLKLIALSLIWVLSLLVMRHRVSTRCHSVEQILAGAALGALGSVVFHRMLCSNGTPNKL